MSRKTIITIAIIFGVLLIAGITVLGIIANEANYKNVSFTIEGPAELVDIYKKPSSGIEEKAPKINSVSNKQTIKLRIGEYYYIPTGDTVDSTSVNFTVNDVDENQTITIISSYSSEYLQKLANEQAVAITSVLTESFPSVMPRYEVNNLRLIGKGDLAGVLITPIGMDENSPDAYYRALLKKEGDSWKVIGRPEIVLTKFNTPNISTNILEIVNNLSLR